MVIENIDAHGDDQILPRFKYWIYSKAGAGIVAIVLYAKTRICFLC